jgi:pyrimidine-nucleoside phosphorylase
MIDAFLRTKRDGGHHAPEDIGAFVRGVTDGTVSREQAAAWLAFSFTRGLDDGESVALLRAMTESGEVLAWPGIDGPFADKHSTGGVGDKVSLVLAPLWAELGMRVPMVSGRGLGHTGGTLDKLEAIPGYRTDLSTEELRRVLSEVGCFISGQTAALAPADRVLYALRNEIQAVEYIPFIVASILSKKLAEGIEHLVLDVKVGSGAFMKTLDDARALAAAMVRAGNLAGVRTRAILTDMSQPLGRACGNAIEVEEALECLRGGGPPDLRENVLACTDHADAAAVLDSGAAAERFARMVRAQGGELSAMRHPVNERVLVADADGYVARCDALGIGRAAFLLGAGRLRQADAVHPGVGVRVHAKVGDRVARGQPLATMLHAGRAEDLAWKELVGAFALAEAPVARQDLLLGEVT